VSLLPQIFLLRGVVFRGLTVGYMVLAITFLMAWVSLVVRDVDWRGVAFHLQGDTPLTLNPQKHRILQTLQSLHHVTILPGRSTWSYNEAPSEAGFSENRCYIAWFAKGDEAGHVGEADFRDRQNNAFYDGKLPDPAGFLRANDIAAILIYPDDNIPDEALAKFKEQLTGTYYYVDCRGDGPQNAGVFMRGLR
jgi:hypothetical protein